MTDDEIVIRATNAIVRYCAGHKCRDCAIGSLCMYVRKDGYMPQYLTPYNVASRLQELDEFRKQDRGAKKKNDYR